MFSLFLFSAKKKLGKDQNRLENQRERPCHGHAVIVIIILTEKKQNSRNSWRWRMELTSSNPPNQAILGFLAQDQKTKQNSMFFAEAWN